MAYTDETTLVAYHGEYAHEARPAVNVKVHDFDREAFWRLADKIGEDAAERYFEAAFQFVAEDFWEDATEQARELGLGGIEQEGRMGGWLVITRGDPQDMTGLERFNWLHKYRKLADWCRKQVQAAPEAQSSLAFELAEDELDRVAHAEKVAALAAAGAGL